MEEKDKKNLKSVTYLLLANAKDLKNCKSLRMVEVDIKTNSFHGIAWDYQPRKRNPS